MTFCTQINKRNALGRSRSRCYVYVVTRKFLRWLALEIEIFYGFTEYFVYHKRLAWRGPLLIYVYGIRYVHDPNAT